MKSKKGRGLCLFLAAVMVVELGVAGFRYPGFLRKEPVSGGNPGGYNIPGNGGSLLDGNGGNDQLSDDYNTFFDLLSTENISVRYSAQEISDAPQMSAAVTSDLPMPQAVSGFPRNTQLATSAPFTSHRHARRTTGFFAVFFANDISTLNCPATWTSDPDFSRDSRIFGDEMRTLRISA